MNKLDRLALIRSRATVICGVALSTGLIPVPAVEVAGIAKGAKQRSEVAGSASVANEGDTYGDERTDGSTLPFDSAEKAGKLTRESDVLLSSHERKQLRRELTLLHKTSGKAYSAKVSIASLADSDALPADYVAAPIEEYQPLMPRDAATLRIEGLCFASTLFDNAIAAVKEMPLALPAPRLA